MRTRSEIRSLSEQQWMSKVVTTALSDLTTGLEYAGLFEDLRKSCPETFEAVASLYETTTRTLNLIPSSNVPSVAVLAASGLTPSSSPAEGYGSKRYYAVHPAVLEIQEKAIKKLCSLFNCRYANIQPISGSNANLAAYAALLEKGDAVMVLSTQDGGHISHLPSFHILRKLYEVVEYGVDPQTERIDPESVSLRGAQTVICLSPRFRI